MLRQQGNSFGVNKEEKYIPGGGDSRLFGPMCLVFLNRCREWFHCLRSFPSLLFISHCPLNL